MAFAITNKAQMNLNAPGQPGALHYELADQVAAGTLTDTGIAGAKFIRVRLQVKSGLGNTNTFQFQVRVDDNAALASPEVAASSPVLTFATNDTLLNTEVYGWSETGFRYFQIVGVNSGGTAVYDAIVDVW
jgi:hypothetical protein